MILRSSIVVVRVFASEREKCFHPWSHAHFSRTITSHSPQLMFNIALCLAEARLSSSMNLRIEPYVQHHLVCIIWLDATHYVKILLRAALHVSKTFFVGNHRAPDFYYAFKLDNFAINLFTLRLFLREARGWKRRKRFNVMHGRWFFPPPNIIAGILQFCWTKSSKCMVETIL